MHLPLQRHRQQSPTETGLYDAAEGFDEKDESGCCGSYTSKKYANNNNAH